MKKYKRTKKMSVQYTINDKYGYPRVKLSTDKLMYNKIYRDIFNDI